MTIEKIQNELVAAGYQWVEHIFNDGIARNCSIRLTLCKSPHHFDSCTYDDCEYKNKDVGWGRFERLDAWLQAKEWLLK